ncbi:MAG: hypothetical protein AAFV90_19775, partial [Cyanobacteria bacterium J06634_5]
TGGWQTYQDFTLTDINLTAGAQELRLDFLTGKLNLNYIDIIPQNTATASFDSSASRISLGSQLTGTTAVIDDSIKTNSPGLTANPISTNSLSNSPAINVGEAFF